MSQLGDLRAGILRFEAPGPSAGNFEAHMRVIVGLCFGGPTLTEPEDFAPGWAGIGRVSWGPSELLRDLELRLGLTLQLEPQALRVARWQARLAAVAPRGRYYSRSFEVDPLGTATALLRLRDTLIAGGWQGQSIANGGRRLDALSELEQLGHPALPAGSADRLASVEKALATTPSMFYAELALAEALELWPVRWQAVFRSLEQSGTRLTGLQVTLPGAHPESDLGAVQAALAGMSSAASAAIRGDGSLVLMTAETSWEAACATAAVLAELAPQRVVVIREREASALEGALAAHGLRTHGLTSVTPWRSALQVLPLALELAFEPKDPHRVLELLTLPIGPFQGRPGHTLAKALTDAPGIGGPRWAAAKAKIASNEEHSERALRELATIEAWLEAPGADAGSGAPKPALLAVVERVRAWLLSRIPSAPDDITLLIAAQQTSAVAAALASDPRETLDLVGVRKLVASVLSSGTALDLIPEQAGRFDHVSSPAALWSAREVVVWWSFNDGSEQSRFAWRKPELVALRQAGVHLPDPRLLLAEQERAARRAFACATQRLLLVSAGRAAGTPLGTHPLWDEIVTRAGLDDAALSRVVVSAQQLRSPSGVFTALPRPPLTSHSSLPLPGGRIEWTAAPDGAAIGQLSYASLDALLGCPLRWALRYRAGTYRGGHALPPLFQLSGSLGHRLVEKLQEQEAFGASEAELRDCARRTLGELMQREGALLLRPGMAFERSQLERQLLESVVELARTLRAAGLCIVAVEQPIDVAYGDGKLEGRIDLLVARAGGASAIIDMKWGIARYREQLESGQALQLALYAFAHAAERGTPDLPDAAYFSLKQGKLFGLASSVLPIAEVVLGPSLAETWQRAERSLGHAARSIQAGRLPVTGLKRSVPLLTSLGVSRPEHAAHFAHPPQASCQYCDFDGLCGRRWEAAP